MGLFTRDLYRSFAIGFALGALGLLGVMKGESQGALGNSVVPAALAAPVK